MSICFSVQVTVIDGSSHEKEDFFTLKRSNFDIKVRKKKQLGLGCHQQQRSTVLALFQAILSRKEVLEERRRKRERKEADTTCMKNILT